jgi:hypothetical protein
VLNYDEKQHLYLGKRRRYEREKGEDMKEKQFITPHNNKLHYTTLHYTTHTHTHTHTPHTNLPG